ncbi:MAG: DUF4445 domain-containing protein [Victivallales bacterium]|nr:DUF4445 domain-containing protein [Victivallales bacterium]
MPKITFTPSGKSITVSPGTELLDAAREADVEVKAPCGGKGTCGKCIVRITSGEVDSNSLGVLPGTSVADGFVLACKTKIIDSDITVEVPEQSGRTGGKFTDAEEDTRLVRRELFPEKWNFDPLAVKWCVDVPDPQLEDGLSDIDRLTRKLQLDWGKKEFIYPLSVIRDVANTLRKENGNVTATLIREPERFRVIDIEPGNTTVRHYGIAVDIGTTTIAVQLIFLPLAESIATRSDYNDQVECGLDVISRINYARRPDRLEELRERVLKTINSLIRQICGSHSVAPEEICNAVISGNTTMIHLLLGLNPEYIRLDPYTPTLLETPYLTADEVGININPQSWVYISPNVGSYVGGDITAGILCTDLATDSEDVSMFIDIGTNGEVVIGNNDFMMTCACSAGPAFEGGGIEFGMRAALGAIEAVCVDPETGICEYRAIGDVKPEGICGSGMISLLADLFISGWLDSAGKLNRDKASKAINVSGRFATYTIAPAEETKHGKPIIISELDIENIIRAKAAIYSACALMLEQVGMGFEDLANVYIAGGFGRFLDLEKATIIGLVPDLPRDRFHYIGNSSLTGTYMVLVSQEFRTKQIELAKRMTYVELSTDPEYMDQYTGALFLPHTDPDRFPSVTAIKI